GSSFIEKTETRVREINCSRSRYDVGGIGTRGLASVRRFQSTFDPSCFRSIAYPELSLSENRSKKRLGPIPRNGSNGIRLSPLGATLDSLIASSCSSFARLFGYGSM